jgi:hypothetical protein
VRAPPFLAEAANGHVHVTLRGTPPVALHDEQFWRADGNSPVRVERDGITIFFSDYQPRGRTLRRRGSLPLPFRGEIDPRPSHRRPRPVGRQMDRSRLARPGKRRTVPDYLTSSLQIKKIVSAEGSMARDIFTVVLLEQQWTVRFRGRHQRYGTQDEAISAAVDAAYRGGLANPDGAQVRVQDANVFRTEWTYGIDPPRPR